MDEGSARRMWTLAGALVLVVGTGANAETFLVNTGTDDELNPPPGGLRAAVTAAETGDVIEFVQGLTVVLRSGFEIPEGLSDVTIRGPVVLGGTGRIVVAGDGFVLEDVTLRGVDVVTGRTDTSPLLQELRIRRCTFGDSSVLFIDNSSDASVDACRFDGVERPLDAEVLLGDSTGTSVTGCSFGPDARITVGAARDVAFTGNTTEGGKAFFEALSGTVSGNTFGGDEPVIVRYSAFAGGSDALVVEDNSLPALFVERLDVTVRGNRVGTSAAPARARAQESALVTGRKAPLLQVIAENPALATSPGVGGDVVVHANIVTGGRSGLLVVDRTAGATSCTVSANIVRGASDVGLQVSTVAVGAVLENVVEDIGAPVGAGKKKTNGGRSVGLLLAGVRDGLVVADNQVRRVDGTGLRLANGATAELSGNTVEDNSGWGVDTTLAPGAFSGLSNAIRRNGAGGVSLGSRWRLDLQTGEISGNGGDGVAVGKGAAADLLGVLVEGNGGDGVSFAKRSGGRVQGCDSVGNAGAGVRIQKKATVAVRGTLMGGNGGVPIDLDPAGATANRKRKKANDDLDFPEMEFDVDTRRLVGTAEPSAVVEVFVGDGGEPVEMLGSVVAGQDGAFSFPDDGPLECDAGTELVATATRPDDRTTSEVSDPVLCEVPEIPILRASQNDAGAGGTETSTVEVNARSSSRSISDDGRFIVFETLSPNLVGDDTNDERDVFVHDAVTRTTRRVSVLPGGGELSGSTNRNAGGRPVISGDGRFVLYNTESTTWRSQLGDFAYTNIIRTDLQTGAAIPIGNALEAGSPKLGGGGFEMATNRDGSLVAFVHNSTSYYTEVDDNRSDDVYLWLGDDSYEWISRTYQDGPGDAGATGVFAACRAPRMSGDGDVVTFASALQGLVPDGPSSYVPTIYVRRRSTGTIDIASRAPDGSFVLTDVHALSDSGRYVAFTTSAALVPEDTDSDQDVYVRDIEEGTTTLASPDPEGIAFAVRASNPAISSDGNLVAYELRRASSSSATLEVWLHDRTAQTVTRLSGGFRGDAFSNGEYPGLTPDGHFLVFQSSQPDLLPDDADQNFEKDVFRRALTASEK